MTNTFTFPLSEDLPSLPCVGAGLVRQKLMGSGATIPFKPLQPALDFGDSAITSLFPSTITSVASPLLPVKLGAQVLGRALDGYIASWVPAHRIGPGSATVPLPFYPDSPNLTHLS